MTAIYISFESDIKIFLKWFINNYSKCTCLQDYIYKRKRKKETEILGEIVSILLEGGLVALAAKIVE